MPISFRRGNIFEQADINVIAHQANTRGTLAKRTSSGIASQVEKLYPAAADADVAPYDESKIGTYTSGKGKDGRIIINVYSQIVQKTSYDAIDAVFTKLEEKLRAFNEEHPDKKKVLGVPYLYGSGIADGKWEVIEAVFHSIFDKSPVQLVIVNFNPPKAGDPQ